MQNKVVRVLIALTLMTSILPLCQPAQAQRLRFAGSRGTAVGYNSQGQYGQRLGLRAAGANGGRLGLRAGSYTGPNGGKASRNSNWQYQNGVGGSANRDFSATSAGGASARGYKTNNYDATTGTGTATKGRDYTSKDGSTYGYDSTTAYTKGEGAQKTIETQNKGDYTIDYSKGSKPVVTPAP